MARTPRPLNKNPRPAGFDDAVVAAIPRITKFARKLTHNAERAEDLVQEVLVRAFAYHATFEMGTNMFGWLCFMMKNRFLDQIKASKRLVEDPDGAYAAKIVQPAAQETAVEIGYVRRRIEALHPETREALLMSIDGNTPAQIAEVMHCPEGTIKSRVHRARATISEDAGVWA